MAVREWTTLRNIAVSQGNTVGESLRLSDLLFFLTRRAKQLCAEQH